MHETHKRLQLLILPPTLYEEFNKDLILLESKYELKREAQNIIKNNRYSMQGNTYQIIYHNKCGKYKSFCKELNILWTHFNHKHPKTVWKGK